MTDTARLRALIAAATPSKVFMTKFGKGKGDCLPACLSTLTGIPIAEIPDVGHDGDAWFSSMVNFMESRGWGVAYFKTENSMVSGCITGYVIGEIDLGEDENHCVVMKSVPVANSVQYETRFELYHDPNPRPVYKAEPVLVGVFLLTYTIAEVVNALPGLLDENERLRAANVKSRILGIVDGFNSAASVEVKQQEDQIGALENALRSIVAIQGAAMRDDDKLNRAYKIALKALNAEG